MAKTALEAQFQDVVRRQIDNVNKAFVGLQAARIDRLASEAAVRRAETLLEEETREAAALPASDVAGRRKAAELIRELGFVLEKAKLTGLDAAEAFEDAQETLGLLLGVPPGQTFDLVPRGGLRPIAPEPPPLDEMVRLASGCRPDVRAVRLGVNRARAEVDLQRANRVDDVYLFYDPIHPGQRPHSAARLPIVGGGAHLLPSGLQPQSREHCPRAEQCQPDAHGT